MNEDYVSTKLARKLQQKGYPLKKVYRQNGFPMFYDLPQDHPDWSQCDAWYLPTIWEVLKWLREEKKLFVEPSLFKYGYESYVQSTIFEDDKDYADTWYVEGFYSNYERAALAGIKYVLDNLI